jgi:hypothetical protein
MTKICREAEASLDYYAMFKNILKQAPMPMSPLESLASSAVRTAHKVRPARAATLHAAPAGLRTAAPRHPRAAPKPARDQRATRTQPRVHEPSRRVRHISHLTSHASPGVVLRRCTRR